MRVSPAAHRILLACSVGLLAAAPLRAQPAPIDCVDTSAWRSAAAAERELLPRPSLPRPFGPPPSPQVGDTWDWYIWDLAGLPSATLQPCTVRAEGPNVLVVVRDADWGTLVTQADVDSVVEHFETTSYGLFPTQGIHALDTGAFGDPPLGLDLDPRTYLLYYDFTISSDGFLGWADSQPDQGTGLNKSNECEVLYLNCGPDVGVDHAPQSRYMLSVIAHEFEHVIHRGYDADEQNWLDESLAEIGMYLFDPYGEVVDSFVANPDVSVTLDNPGGSYGARYFWGLHLYEEYGGAATTREIVSRPEAGIASVNLTLANQGFPEDFAGVFDTWVASNWLDEPAIDGGVHGYDDFDFAPFAPSATHSVHPAGPLPGSVSLWAADYIELSGFSASALRLSFNGNDAQAFSVQVLLQDSTGTLLPVVAPLTLDGSQDGSFDLGPASSHDTATLVIGAVAPAVSPAAYSYATEIIAPPAPVDLRVRKGAGAPEQDVRLDWFSTGTPPFTVFRGSDPETVLVSPDLTVPGVLETFHVDPSVPGPLAFYLVENR